MSPVQYLDKIGLLGPDVVSAHCIFVDAADEKTLAQKQVGCVHNPSSNMMIASGVSPVAEMRSAGVAVGLGTDGPAGSNNDLDLMPRATDISAVEVKSNPVPTRTNPLGVKGAGEAGCVGAMPAVANALVDALSHLGIRHIEMPATPERLWRAIHQGNAK